MPSVIRRRLIPEPTTIPKYSPESSSIVRALLSLLLFLGAGAAALIYPLGPAWLLLGLGMYAAVLWRYPQVGLPAIFALLPLLNFAPWSGWILLNEFDLLVAVTLAVRLLRPNFDISSPALAAVASPALSRGAKWVIGWVAASFFVSAGIGLWPISPFDANALFTYYSSFNSLRELKGFAWALALLPLLIEEARQPQRMEQRCVAGMLLGLCGVVAVIVWQRAVFAGLLDFAGDYRVEGPFPELHIGGGDVHAYLVTAMPFVVAWVAPRPTARRVALGAALFLLASYALGVTFTRGGYVGYCGALVLMGIAMACQGFRQRNLQLKRVATIAVLAVTGLAVMIPILSGSFMEVRLAGTQTEATARMRHWARTIDMMDKDLTTSLFGMGLGSFPRAFLFKNRDAASATFSYEREDGNGFLRLGSGKPLYLDQRVAVVADKSYTLSLDLRSSDPEAGVSVTLCEKSVQYSFGCKAVSLQQRAAAAGWEHREVKLESGQVGSGPWLLRRPVALSIANARSGSIVEVDNVRLRDESGRDLIANADFSDGGARWFFSADDHLPWHIFNLWVQILFEQGWVGVLALTVAVVISLTRLAAGMWRGNLFSSMLLAALGGFLLIGLTEGLFDGPRVTTLFFLLLFLGLLRRPVAPAERQLSTTSLQSRLAG
ncbi:MAG TPA: O-antigen ligase family protein [Casimicrobiaceae bacterium]